MGARTLILARGVDLEIRGKKRKQVRFDEGGLHALPGRPKLLPREDLPDLGLNVADFVYPCLNDE